MDVSVTDVAIQKFERYGAWRQTPLHVACLCRYQTRYVQSPPTTCSLRYLTLLSGENNTTGSRILLMLNIVTPEDLVDQEYGTSTKMSKKSVLDTVPPTIFVSSASQERQDEICHWRRMLLVPSTQSAQTKLLVSAGCTSKLVDVGHAVCAQGARRTVVCRVINHCNNAERGQSDDASVQFDLFPAA